MSDNGGFTQTHTLGTASPAIDAGNPATCPATDQRSHLRFVDGSGNVSTSCDIGAYEFGYSINVGIEGSGEVTLTPDRADFFYGEAVTLTAISTPGWTFSGWSGATSGTADPLNFTVFGDTSLTATFTQDEYTLSVLTNGSGSVALDPKQNTYHYGDVVTLTLFAAQDWALTDWSGAVSSTDNPLAFTIAGNTAITANFRRTLFRCYLSTIFK